MAASSDSALVEAILGGEVQRYAEVVRRHDEAVRAILRRGARDAAELEELVQETFYLGFRDLERLDAPEALGAWLGAIARRRMAERGRRTRSEAVPLDEVAEAGEEAPELPWIWDEVARLRRPFAQVLRLRYAEGLGYAEIAERLGVPISTVRGRVYEARRALRARLDDGGFETW